MFLGANNMVTYDKGLINSEQEKINKLYAKLGERYYALYADNNDENFVEIIGEIKDCEGKIADHKTQALKAAGLMLCPNCGEEIMLRSLFCNFCGTRVREEAPVTEGTTEESVEESTMEETPIEAHEIAEKEPTPAPERRCANCGNALREGMMFCTECGTPVPAASAQVSAYEKKDAPRFCTECGYKVEDDSAMFCNNCGMRLEKDGDDREIYSNSHDNIPEEKRCPSCGFHTTDKDIIFCIECGTRLV